MKFAFLTALVFATVLLAGCGQGGDQAPPPVSPEAKKNAPAAKGQDTPVDGAPTASTFPGAGTQLAPGSKSK